MKKLQAKLTLSEILEDGNVVGLLDDNDLRVIAGDLMGGVGMDSASMESWKKQYGKLVESAMLVRKEKTEPIGSLSSNMRVPVITQALLQFVARAYPAFVDSDKVVKCKITGSDPQGVKAGQAGRVSEHMSYQLLEEMDDWEGETDRLLLALANGGTAFRKVYWNEEEDRPESKHLPIDNIIFDNSGDSLAALQRVTHTYQLRPREIEERIRAGVFGKFDYKKSGGGGTKTVQVEIKGSTENQQNQIEDDAPHQFYEVHTYLDLDGDDYQEPYIVTIHVPSSNVVRIDARFHLDQVKIGEKGDVIKIVATEHFVAYTLFPGFKGFLGVGIGTILYPLSESITTLINQLTDAGTLANQPPGFVNGLFAGNKGPIRYKPGEIKPLTGAMSVDISKAFQFIPIGQPSPVLFQLLGFISDAAEKVSMSSNLMAGASPSGNQPATTTVALLNEGQKSFGGIMKRILKSAKHEFRLLFELNKRYLDPAVYWKVCDSLQQSAQQPDQQTQLGWTGQPQRIIPPTDYQCDGTDVQPQADISMIMDTQRAGIAQALQGMAHEPGMNGPAIQRYVMETLRVPDPQKFILPPQPPADPSKNPELMMKVAELELKSKEVDIKSKEADATISLKRAQSLLAESQAMQTVTDTQMKNTQSQQQAGERILKLLNDTAGQQPSAQPVPQPPMSSPIRDLADGGMPIPDQDGAPTQTNQQGGMNEPDQRNPGGGFTGMAGIADNQGGP
jgi:chaperonin GroES